MFGKCDIKHCHQSVSLSHLFTVYISWLHLLSFPNGSVIVLVPCIVVQRCYTMKPSMETLHPFPSSASSELSKETDASTMQIFIFSSFLSSRVMVSDMICSLGLPVFTSRTPANQNIVKQRKFKCTKKKQKIDKEGWWRGKAEDCDWFTAMNRGK